MKVYEKYWRSNSGKTAYKKRYVSRNGKRFVVIDDYPIKIPVNNSLPREKNAVKREVKLPEDEHKKLVHLGNLAVLEKAQGVENFPEAWTYWENYDPVAEKQKSIKQEEKYESFCNNKILEISDQLKNLKLIQKFLPDAKFHLAVCRDWDGDEYILITNQERISFYKNSDSGNSDMSKDISKLLTPVLNKIEEYENYVDDDLRGFSDEIAGGKNHQQKMWWSFVDSESVNTHISNFIEEKKVDIVLCQFERSDHKLVKGMSENAFANLYFISDRKKKAKYESDMVETMYVRFGSFQFIFDWNLGNPEIISEESKIAHRLKNALCESDQIWENIEIINENLIFVDDLDDAKNALRNKSLCEKHCFSLV